MERTESIAAGVELNALIAEKVMGWERHRDGIFGQARFFTDSEKEPQPENCPPFSEEIGAAWRLIERFEVLHHDIELRSAIEGWHCIIGGVGWKEHAFAATVPLAVCQAALKAMDRG